MSKLVALGAAIASVGVKVDVTRRGPVLAVVLAALSFAIYAGAIFSVPHLRLAQSCCELTGVATAVSNIVYGAPLGTYYSGVWSYLDQQANAPLWQIVELVNASGAGLTNSPGILHMTDPGGNGVGYPLVATAAFRLFGIHAWALQAAMLLLMALSAAALLWRFRSPGVVAIATLYFGALTIMLFMTPVWEPNIRIQAWVGGVRYFAVVSVLPIIYILLTLLGIRGGQTAARWPDVLLLALQTLILLLTMFLRGSTLPLVGAIVAVALALTWEQRHSAEKLWALFRKLATIGLVVGASLTAIALAVPRDYLTEGRFAPAVWERIVESLGMHPEWPRAGVTAMFDCKMLLPAGIQPGISDDTGHCIWLDYATKHGVPIEKSLHQVLSGDYETAMREAFFRIAARYPNDVLMTFLYYKPRAIVRSVSRSMHFNFAGDRSPLAIGPDGVFVPYPASAEALLAAVLVVVLAQFATLAMPMRELRRIAGVTLIAMLFTLPTYFAGWAAVHTDSELVLYILMILGLAIGAMVILLRSALWPAPPSPKLQIQSS